jgi:hypothetical protein
MDCRKDAFLAAARMAPEIYEITRRHGGVCTIGSCTTRPGIVTSVVEECRITLDQRHLDATSVLALEDLIKFMRANDRHVLISGATRDVYRVLKNSGVLVTIQQGADRKNGESNLFLNRPSNPNLSTRDALKRAQQLLGGEKAEVRIFYDPTKK